MLGLTQNQKANHAQCSNLTIWMRNWSAKNSAKSSAQSLIYLYNAHIAGRQITKPREASHGFDNP